MGERESARAAEKERARERGEREREREREVMPKMSLMCLSRRSWCPSPLRGVQATTTTTTTTTTGLAATTTATSLSTRGRRNVGHGRRRLAVLQSATDTVVQVNGRSSSRR